jgi:phage terminase small subunit
LARAPDERIAKAKEMYLQGMKLVEIASQLNLPEGTVRRWKSTHKWDSERSDKNSERSHKDSEQNKARTKTVAKEVESVMSNEDLTDKQRLFCIYYSKSFNATQSYKKAYGCTYAVALTEGPALKNNPRISSEIDRLKQIILAEAHLEPGDIFQKYMEIAYSDITNYLTFGKKNVTYFNKKGDEITVMESYVDLNECEEVDGSIISEVSQGKEGIKLKLADKMKALQWLSDHMDMATAEQRAKIAQIKAQTDKLTADDKEQSERVVIVNDIPRPGPS